MTAVRQIRTLALLATLLTAGLAQADTSYTWGTTSNVILEPGKSSTTISGVTAYLIDKSKLDQSTILTAVLGGDSSSSLADYLKGSSAVLSSATVDRGLITQKTFTYDFGSTYDSSLYFVLEASSPLWTEGRALYFSETSAFRLSGNGGVSSIVLDAASSKNAVTYATQFSGSGIVGNNGGWYAVVPEPTGGVLMLWGLAMLALRRRGER